MTAPPPEPPDRPPGDAPVEAPCVLVVEDSRTYAELLGRRIRQELGLEVLSAGDYASGVRLADAHRERIFLAILDLNLPDAPDGEIVDAILERNLSVIVLTASFDERVREKIIAKKIVDYVVKEDMRDLEYVVHLIRRIRKNQTTKVLIVDDSDTYRYVLKSNLAPYKYQVLEAVDGRQALDLLQRHDDIRLVISDNQMPGMDGYQLTGEIRSAYSKEQVAIIGLSATSGGSVTARFLKRGANDFLAKPYSKEELFCRVSQNVEMTDLLRESRERADRDALTGLFNRRYFFDLGEKYFASARRKQLELVVAMLDIDFFKAVNDEYGHEAGDLVLRAVAGAIDACLRQTDIVARIGGEEFCVLAVNAGEGFEEVFERVRREVERTVVEYEDDTIRVTLSCGVTSLQGDSLVDMVRRADKLLYQAKATGRNRVVSDVDGQGATAEPDPGDRREP